MKKDKMKPLKKICLPSLLFLLTCSFLLSGCGRKYSSESTTGFYFDTFITITIYDEALPNSQKQDLLTACLDLCETYEQLLSRTREGSDVWKINHAVGTPVAVSADTQLLIERALYYSELTDGLVDLTIAPLSSLWDFTGEDASVPDQTAIDEALAHVDYHNLLLQSGSVTLTDPEASIDLGFIAKGYIADRLKEYLESKNVTSAVISLGGNILTIGHRIDGTAFQIGIQNPFDLTGSSIAVLSVDDQSLVTSGVYERCFETDDGTLYHHLLNAHTGFPENNDLLSVTILSSSSMEGDALSTTCYLLGLNKGLALIRSLEDTEAVFITQDYELVYSNESE